MAHCPECEAIIDLGNDEIEEGQKVDCPECDAELEVVNTNPLQLDLISSGEDEEEQGSW